MMFLIMFLQKVIRRVGGLEGFMLSALLRRGVIRRVGGLEASVMTFR